ncbi:MAG: right-handed parallel beta-helix repeat-containing protein [Candidatus Thorarchaeota archaeon]|jgi:parallel beta-helix repeat protein
MKRKYLRISAILWIFLFALVPSSFVNQQEESNSGNSLPLMTTNAPSEYDPYSPFEITSNLDFANKVSSNSWNGSGTAQDPYIISKINITLETDTIPLLRITDTDVYFIINASLFIGGLNSLHFENVTNGVVSNNSIYFADMQGIYTRNISHCLFDDNLITENGYMGVLADFAVNCTFSNNVIDDNSNIGMKLRDSPNNRVINNTLAKNREHGLSLGNSPYCEVNENMIHSNWEMGISVEVSTPVQISNNTIFDNIGAGITLIGYTPGTNITDNTFYQNGLHGLRIMVNGTQILRNNFINNELHVPGASHISDFETNSNYSENYFNEWTYPDEDRDGVVDIPYSIYSTLKDEHPQISAYPNHRIHILTEPNPIYPDRGFISILFTGTLNVTWGQSSDTVEHDITYSLTYSTNETTTWTEIVSELSITEYQFNASILPENKICNLKVIASCSEMTSESIFESNFTIQEIQEHSLTVPTILQPNDGDTIEFNVTICWSYSIDSWGHSVWYDIYYSPDGGLAWKSLELDRWNSYINWTLDATWNGTYMIKVIAYAECGLTSEDITGSFNVSIRTDHGSTGTPDLGLIVTVGVVSIVGIIALVLVLKRKEYF